MMGLEPTTFCMASRRSSQLSYIRAGRASIAPGFSVGRVQSLVHEPVGQLVVLAADGRVRDVADPAGEARGLEGELLQRLVLDPILARSSASRAARSRTRPRARRAPARAPSRARRSARGTRRRCWSRHRCAPRARRAPSRRPPRARSRTPPARGCRAHRRRSRGAPSLVGIHQRIQVERDLLVRMCRDQRGDDVARLAPGRPSRRGTPACAPRGRLLRSSGRSLAALERPRARRVPGAARVVADSSGSCREDGVASRVERLLGNEPDELVVGGAHRSATLQVQPPKARAADSRATG